MASQHLRNRAILLRLAYKIVWCGFHLSLHHILPWLHMPIPLASFLFLKFPKCVLTPQPLHFLFSLPTKLIPQHFAHLARFHSLGLSLNVISPESSSLTIQDIPTSYVVILYCISLQSTYDLYLVIYLSIIPCLWFITEYNFYVGRRCASFIMYYVLYSVWNKINSQ